MTNKNVDLLEVGLLLQLPSEDDDDKLARQLGVETQETKRPFIELHSSNLCRRYPFQTFTQIDKTITHRSQK